MIIRPVHQFFRHKAKRGQFTIGRNRSFTTQNEENIGHKEYQSRTKRSSKFRHDLPSFLEIYHNLRLPSKTTGLGLLAFFALVSTLITSQYKQRKKEKKVLEEALELLRSDDVQSIRRGIKLFYQSFYSKQHAYSGTADICIGTSIINNIEADVTDLFMDLFNKNMAPDINTDILKIIRFLSQGSDEVKIQLARKHIRLLIASAIQSYIYRSNDKEWQLSCEIILSLLYCKDSAKEIDRSSIQDLSRFVSRMQQKLTDPLSSLVTTLLSNEISGKSNIYSVLDKESQLKLLKDVNDEIYGKIGASNNVQSNSILRPLYLSILAAVWGNARWLYATSKFNMAPEARNLLFSQLHIGKHMFYLFTADYMLLRIYRYLSPESNDINIDKIKDVEENLLVDNSFSPLAVSINDIIHKTPYLSNNLIVSLPLIHNALFIAGCTWMIVRYKYVIFPILYAFKLKRDDKLRVLKEKNENYMRRGQLNAKIEE